MCLVRAWCMLTTTIFTRWRTNGLGMEVLEESRAGRTIKGQPEGASLPQGKSSDLDCEGGGMNLHVR